MKHPILVLVCALALSANLNAQKIPTLKPLKELPGTLMPVEKKGRWGYADQKGKTVIKPVFEVAEGFRPVTADDVTMAAWFRESACPLVVAANKVDKIGKREIEGNMAIIRETLSLEETTLLLPFSAEKGIGRDRLLAERSV